MALNGYEFCKALLRTKATNKIHMHEKWFWCSEINFSMKFPCFFLDFEFSSIVHRLIGRMFSAMWRKIINIKLCGAIQLFMCKFLWHSFHINWLLFQQLCTEHGEYLKYLNIFMIVVNWHLEIISIVMFVSFFSIIFPFVLYASSVFYIVVYENV